MNKVFSVVKAQYLWLCVVCSRQSIYITEGGMKICRNTFLSWWKCFRLDFTLIFMLTSTCHRRSIFYFLASLHQLTAYWYTSASQKIRTWWKIQFWVTSFEKNQNIYIHYMFIICLPVFLSKSHGWILMIFWGKLAFFFHNHHTVMCSVSVYIVHLQICCP